MRKLQDFLFPKHISPFAQYFLMRKGGMTIEEIVKIAAVLVGAAAKFMSPKSL